MVQVCSIEGYEDIATTVYVTIDGYVLHKRRFMAFSVARGYVGVNAPLKAGGTRTIAVTRLVWEAFRGPLVPGDKIYRVDSDTRNNALDNLVLNDHKRSSGWAKVQVEQNKDKLAPDLPKQCAIEKDGEWQIFSSLGQTLSYFRQQGYTTTRNKTRLADNAKHNCNRLKGDDKLNLRSNGWRRNYGYRAFLLDELSDKHREFIYNRLTN